MSEFLLNFDGVASNTVFCMWTGSNGMSEQRIVSLWSILNNIHCPLVFLNRDSLWKWERPDSKFHPAFEFLSETHKSDYLRCYLMHHYGGGYTDLKMTTTSWESAFEKLRNSGKLGLGYTEIGPNGVAPIVGELGDRLRADFSKLIGLCSFIFKKGTPLTRIWYQQTTMLLDSKLEALRKNPARHPQDKLGASFEDGTLSEYPLRWTQLLGDIFHPVIYEFNTEIIHDNIAPLFYGYR